MREVSACGGLWNETFASFHICLCRESETKHPEEGVHMEGLGVGRRRRAWVLEPEQGK